MGNSMKFASREQLQQSTRGVDLKDACRGKGETKMNREYVNSLTKEEILKATVVDKWGDYFVNGIEVPFQDALQVRVVQTGELETPFISSISKKSEEEENYKEWAKNPKAIEKGEHITYSSNGNPPRFKRNKKVDVPTEQWQKDIERKIFNINAKIDSLQYFVDNAMKSIDDTFAKKDKL